MIRKYTLYQIVSTGHSKVKIENKEPVEVDISGNAIIIFKSELLLNDKI